MAAPATGYSALGGNKTLELDINYMARQPFPGLGGSAVIFWMLRLRAA